MIVNHIYDWASKQPAKPAIIHNDVPIGYAQFAHAIDAARRFLAGQDLPAGKTAVVLITHRATLWAVILALRSLGMNTICVQSLDQVEALAIKDVGAVVATRDDIAAHGITRPKAFGRRIIAMPDSIWRSPPTGELTPIDDPARPYGGHILYTSGTTGEYKKVLMDGRQEEAQVERDLRHRRIEPDSVVHMLGFGLWSGVGFKQPLSVWRAGATLVIDQGPDMLRNFFRHRPSFVSITPVEAHELVARTVTVRRPDRMPIVSLVGGFVSPQLLKVLRNAKFDDVMNNYGATECSHILRSHVEDVDRLAWLAPASDRRIEIVDDDDRPCAVGEEGRLRVALLDHDAHGYLDDPETSATMFRDGWFYPGDLAVARDDGRIRILGRAGDVLNIGGQKLATGPLEQELRQILDVENVCLFQGVDGDGVEELVIVLEADELPPEAVIERVTANVRVFDRVRVEAVRPFPRTTTGMHKIQRRELRKMVFPASRPANG
jgi:acyl-coenzyme A synthetase/AMP-(fatty) acid ligase